MAELLIGAVAVFGFALVSRRLMHAPVTAPMVFTGLGLAVGTGGLGWFDLALTGEGPSILIEATLVLVLFTDAVRIDLRTLRRDVGIPARLLGLGLPGTLLAGAGLGLVVFDELDLIEAALLAAVLTPTDPALGQAMVCDRRLPVRLRQGLNVESGLNDGAMLPIVTVLLAAAAAERSQVDSLGEFVARQLGFGVLAGIAAGLVGGWVLVRQVETARIEGVYRQLGTVAIAVGAYAGAELLQGNGFIAAFVAGLAFGLVGRSEGLRSQEFTEDEGELLTGVTFLLFGAVLVGPRLDEISVPMLGYAVGSLTVVRMLPVLLALTGSGLAPSARVYLSWFGPRGLASILFALLVAEGLPGPTGELIFTAAAATVLLSVLTHGLSAAPWTAWLARRLASGPSQRPEQASMPEMPTRRRLG